MSKFSKVKYVNPLTSAAPNLNRGARPGMDYTFDFGKTIGTVKGKNVSKLKVAVINGKVHTAIPVKN
ncbi:MAG: hypothetical protein BalsKO_25400 [Balneolaceae bacterium]